MYIHIQEAGKSMWCCGPEKSLFDLKKEIKIRLTRVLFRCCCSGLKMETVRFPETFVST
jgi:hypothetical protein